MEEAGGGVEDGTVRNRVGSDIDRCHRHRAMMPCRAPAVKGSIDRYAALRAACWRAPLSRRLVLAGHPIFGAPATTAVSVVTRPAPRASRPVSACLMTSSHSAAEKARNTAVSSAMTSHVQSISSTPIGHAVPGRPRSPAGAARSAAAIHPERSGRQLIRARALAAACAFGPWVRQRERFILAGCWT